MSEWISVKDRLPEPYVAVLVWEKDDTKEGGFAYVDRHDGEVWKIGSLGNGAVTHWMPLPEPPEPEEDHIAEAGKMMRAAVTGVWEYVRGVLRA